MFGTIAFCFVLAASRIWIGYTVEPENFTWISAYKDVAHLFMGGLFVAAWIKGHRWQWTLFWIMNAVEVAVAVCSRVG